VSQCGTRMFTVDNFPKAWSLLRQFHVRPRNSHIHSVEKLACSFLITSHNLVVLSPSMPIWDMTKMLVCYLYRVQALRKLDLEDSTFLS